MKKILIIFFMLFFASVKVYSMTFEQAFSQTANKPQLVLIYAPWVDNYQSYIQKYRALEDEFGDKFNYTYVNIATEEAKYFNSIYNIYPNIPYVLMFRGSGHILRYIPRECLNDKSCMVSRIKSFNP